jgi:isopenicillin N synthase-like dioxygenase
MAQGHFDSIPMIDVSALGGSDESAKRLVALELDRAARTSGFLYIRGHGLPVELVRGVESAAASFFALDDAIKRRYVIGSFKNHRGYVPPGEEVFYGQTESKDTKEAFDLCFELPETDPDYVAGNRLLGPNVWPSELPDFRSTVSAYYRAVFELGRRLLGGFALALGLPPEHFEPVLSKPPSQLRLVHYPASLEFAGEGAMGISSHTDYEVFTILHTTRPGLEVVNAAGRWIDAPPIPGAFVVNLGDMMEVLTNGRWVSTAHRVRRVTEERYSFPLFFSLDYHAVVEPIPSLLADGEAPRYERLIAGEHLLAQTAQSFRYFKRLIESGEFRLPSDARGLSSFGRDRRAAPSFEDREARRSPAGEADAKVEGGSSR